MWNWSSVPLYTRGSSLHLPNTMTVSFPNLYLNCAFTKTFIYFPRLESRKGEILAILQEFLEKEKLPKVSLPSFVIDFIVAPHRQHKDKRVAYVVELNPLAEFA